jgi:hypothetical protein
VSSERSGHPVAIGVVLVLAVVVGVIAITSIWANQQLLDTGSWVSVSNRLLKNSEVRHRVATFLGEELVADTEAQLLAAGQGETAERVMGPLRAQSTSLAEEVMKTKRFRVVWREANRAGHRALLRVLDEKGGAGGEAVVVDLTPALRQLAGALGEDSLARELGAANLAAQVEPGAARIKVLEGEELNQAQDVVRVVRHLTLPAVIALILLYGFALLLGRRRLPRTLLAVGVAFIATGLLALLARSLAGHQIVDRLLGGEADREAADAAWGIATSKVSDLATVAIGAGVIVVLLLGALAVARRAAEAR